MNLRTRLVRAGGVASMPRRLREVEFLGINRRVRMIRAALVASLLLFAAVLAMPVRVWLGQQGDIDRATAQLAELEASNDRLEKRVEESPLRA